MSMHISAQYGEIAPNVLLPGDPIRAKYMADKYLESPVLVNEIRNMWGYTGTYKGERVSIMSTGMGVPSMIIYATELCRDYGCKKLVRVGTAGAFRENILLGDILLSQAVSPTSSINDYDLPGHFSPIADFELLSKAYRLCREREHTVYVGNTVCNDHLYIDEKLEYSKRWAKYGIIGSELEGAGLYTVAAKYNVKALMILSVIINMYRQHEEISTKEKESGLDTVISLALDAVTDAQ